MEWNLGMNLAHEKIITTKQNHLYISNSTFFIQQVFSGNTDATSTVIQNFSRVVNVTHIMIYPIRAGNNLGRVSLRLELYGCEGKSNKETMNNCYE